MTDGSPEVAVSISTPGDWIVVDRTALEDPTAVDALLDGRLAAAPELEAHRDELVSAVASTLARANRQGIVFAAVLARAEPETAPLMANLAVAACEAPLGDNGAVAATAAPAPSSAEELGAALAAADAAEGVSERDVRSLLMPAGPALRVARLFELPLTDGGPRIVVLSVQYFLREREGDQWFVLSFTSPSVGAHSELQRMFHEIAQTFRIGTHPA